MNNPEIRNSINVYPQDFSRVSMIHLLSAADARLCQFEKKGFRCSTDQNSQSVVVASYHFEERGL